MREHKKAVYIILLTSGRLNSYLTDRGEPAQERFERIVELICN
ncbi:TnpV protein [Candidatus Acetatifactor stercoripullorum]